MQARFITQEQLQAAADEVGVRVNLNRLNVKGDRWQVKVNPGKEKDEDGDRKYQRESPWTGYRVHAVCWHGFRDFFRACFRRAPDAVFRTAMDTWHGSEDFEARYQESGFKNIGSMMRPVSAAEACRCPESGRAV